MSRGFAILSNGDLAFDASHIEPDVNEIKEGKYFICEELPSANRFDEGTIVSVDGVLYVKKGGAWEGVKEENKYPYAKTIVLMGAPKIQGYDRPKLMQIRNIVQQHTQGGKTHGMLVKVDTVGVGELMGFANYEKTKYHKIKTTADNKITYENETDAPIVISTYKKDEWFMLFVDIDTTASMQFRIYKDGILIHTKNGISDVLTKHLYIDNTPGSYTAGYSLMFIMHGDANQSQYYYNSFKENIPPQYGSYKNSIFCERQFDKYWLSNAGSFIEFDNAVIVQSEINEVHSGSVITATSNSTLANYLTPNPRLLRYKKIYILQYSTNPDLVRASTPGLKVGTTSGGSEFSSGISASSQNYILARQVNDQVGTSSGPTVYVEQTDWTNTTVVVFFTVERN